MPYESATLLVRGMEVGTSSKKATIRHPQGWRAKNVDINLGRVPVMKTGQLFAIAITTLCLCSPEFVV